MVKVFYKKKKILLENIQVCITVRIAFIVTNTESSDHTNASPIPYSIWLVCIDSMEKNHCRRERMRLENGKNFWGNQHQSPFFHSQINTYGS